VTENAYLADLRHRANTVGCELVTKRLLRDLLDDQVRLRETRRENERLRQELDEARRSWLGKLRRRG
jgi:cell shape-determining protein MreC